MDLITFYFLTAAPFGLLAVATLLTAWCVFVRMRKMPGATFALLSTVLALVQLGGLWIANMATLNYAIGELACLGGIIGYFVTLALASVEGVALLVLAVRQRLRLSAVLWFWGPRMLLHAVFAAGFAWSFMMCTV